MDSARVAAAGEVRVILGVDPGPTLIGWALLEHRVGAPLGASRLLGAGVVATDEVLDCRVGRTGAGAAWIAAWSRARVVAVERVQSYGISGASLLRTAEVGGAIVGQAHERGAWIDRASVKRGLGVAGAKGSADAAVRERLIEIFGGSKEVAVGKKKTPGPLYGVTSHAWAALAVAVVVADVGATLWPWGPTNR